MKAGDIHWVNLDPVVGDEIKKKRPVVTLNPGHKKNLKFAIVLPITAWDPNRDRNPFFVCLEPDGVNELRKKSTVDCFQIRAVCHKRFAGKTGSVSDEILSRIKKSLSLILDIDPDECL